MNPPLLCGIPTEAARVPPINLTRRLYNRQMGKRNVHNKIMDMRSYALSLPVNTTLVDVDKPTPNCFLRKFTPDGSALLSYTLHTHNVVMYDYNGVQSLSPLLAAIPPVDAKHTEWQQRQTIDRLTRGAFDAVLTRRWSTHINAEGDTTPWQIQKESALFTADSKFVVVVASSALHAADRALDTMNVEMGQRSLDGLSHLGSTSRYMVMSLSIADGHVCDRITLPMDKIAAAYNNGVQLCGHTLAILSMQHQMIHLFSIDDSTGKFTALRCVGSLTKDENELKADYSGAYVESSTSTRGTSRCFAPSPMGGNAPAVDRSFSTGLKHQLLVWLYERAKAKNDPLELLKFHNLSKYYQDMKMCRMQFYGDETTLMIRASSESVIQQKWSHQQAASTALADSTKEAPVLIFVYDWQNALVINVFDSYTPELMALFERDVDLLRHPTPSYSARIPHNSATSNRKRSHDEMTRGRRRTLPLSMRQLFPCTPASCIQARYAAEKHKRTLQVSGYGDDSEVFRRLLSCVPHSSQSYNVSPYVDMSLFSYDERLIPMIERPRTAADSALRFQARDSAQTAFTIYTGDTTTTADDGHGVRNRNTVVYYVWHPREPLCFSIQRGTAAHATLNLHFFASATNGQTENYENQTRTKLIVEKGV